MHQIVYRWEVEEANRDAFLVAWEKATKGISDSTEGARGSICIVSVERPTEIITIAKWDELEQWREFVRNAKSGAMSEMHTLGQQVSHDAYHQCGDFTI